MKWSTLSICGSGSGRSLAETGAKRCNLQVHVLAFSEMSGHSSAIRMPGNQMPLNVDLESPKNGLNSVEITDHTGIPIPMTQSSGPFSTHYSD
jgi:hypothetical protein